jgi:hypothetical protein
VHLAQEQQAGINADRQVTAEFRPAQTIRSKHK